MSTVADEKAREKAELDHEKQLLAEGDDLEAIEGEYAQQFTKGIVPTTDDPSAPSFTVRMVVMGTLWATIIGLVNTIFSFRTVTFSISPSVAALLSYPMGIFFARVLPRGILNPGPFTIKEHVLLYIIASSATKPYGIENVITQKFAKFLNDPEVNYWNSILFIITTQMIGYGLSGMTRRYLVRPAAMYWPGVLPTVAMFVAFHERNTQETEEVKAVGGLSRYSFFFLSLSVAFVWQWFPSYFASVLQTISLLCLFSSSKTARFLGSSSPNMGPGVLSISLDWTTVSYFGPLSSPWWTSVNLFIGNVIVTWIVAPLLYYRNPFGNPTITRPTPYRMDDGTTFPVLNSNSLYTNKGRFLNPTTMYDKRDYSLNQTAYDAIKPIYLAPGFVMTYTMSFFLLTSGITHVALWYHKDIIRQTKEMLAQVDEAQPDIHNELMKAYPDIPEWMYLAWLGFWVVVMILVGLLTPFKLPWWGVFFGLALAFVFIVPSGIVQGSSGLQIPLNIITQLTMGLLVPGQTVPVMTFKSYGYNIMIQALNLSSDLKIGHYLHINPLHMVFSQIWGTFVGAVTNTAAVWIAIAYFPLDTPDWRYTGHTTFYNAGAIWGAIGPARFFGPSSPYFSLNLGYLLGILLPFLPWTANKFFPHPYWRFVHFPVLATIVQPGNPGSIVFSTLILAFIFQYLVFTYAHGWWVKYNYVLAAALDSGAAIGVLVATLTYIRIPSSESAANPGLPDFYCTGRAWNDVFGS